MIEIRGVELGKRPNVIGSCDPSAMAEGFYGLSLGRSETRFQRFVFGLLRGQGRPAPVVMKIYRSGRLVDVDRVAERKGALSLHKEPPKRTRRTSEKAHVDLRWGLSIMYAYMIRGKKIFRSDAENTAHVFDCVHIWAGYALLPLMNALPGRAKAFSELILCNPEAFP